ncbi:Uma2 family endonuclease [Streptomyces sp. NPDC051771]|uniref:Uma2 family endonuclease n=1 Tax=Streptomyces sp. NPDC051771 TaxID=3154847 RepID=UPI00342742F1
MGSGKVAALERLFERRSAEAPLGSRVELLDGEIHVTPMGTGQHASTITELVECLVAADRGLLCATRLGLRLPARPAGGRPDGAGADDRTEPDLVVAPKGSFRNELVWQRPDPVLLVAEVTSASTAGRDRGPKIRAYARAGIPVYLMIDREAHEAVVCSEPDGDDYTHKSVHKLGTDVPLPAPLGFTLDTSAF